MELRDRAIAGDAASDAIDFFFEGGEIRRGDALIFLDDDVARAEEAEAFAEGKMHVERNGRGFAVGVFDGGFVFLGAEGVNPDGRGGVAGVARAGTIVAIDELFADGEFLLHLAEGGIHDWHDELPPVALRCVLGTAGLASWSAACWPVRMKS